jgi:hypothetical protein
MDGLQELAEKGRSRDLAGDELLLKVLQEFSSTLLMRTKVSVFVRDAHVVGPLAVIQVNMSPWRLFCVRRCGASATLRRYGNPELHPFMLGYILRAFYSSLLFFCSAWNLPFKSSLSRPRRRTSA